ncbi:Imm26 family immunity protein [Pseudomonas auratipiscis]|uniref:Imm26 family immunity protein n=1 Tax=Pseudomonas auratipiscis TaxID=3115853 RepID=A0AB35WUA5_9PSED|nr:MULTISPECIES: Imm26 family immunity protein [unclassified Pseudomonas]MEE1866844.1 Imm26 family immunity protein [Pseudomonas sp. 120P]MEE1958740.1 Imm26 family immunity protein [Pseudomonas sp. 119P]
MTRQIITPGTILEVFLSETLYAYGQVVSRSEIAFFDYIGKQITDLSELDSVLNDTLFIIPVMNSAITRGRWKKIAKRPLREAFLSPRDYFVVDQISKSIQIYRSSDDSMRPGTAKQAMQLECAAVWSAEHVEDRLRDHYLGKKNMWLEQLREPLTAIL